MIDIAFLAVAALALLAAVMKAATIQRGGRLRRGQGLLCALFVALSLACLFLSATVQIRANRIYPGLGRLLSNSSSLVAAFTILALLLTLSLPPQAARPKIRRWLAALLAAIAAMTLLFAIAAPPRVAGDFGGLYRTRPALLGYIAIYIAFLGTALAGLLIRAWRYARIARHRRYLRLGLHVMAAGSILGLVYLAEKAVYVVTQWAGLPPPFSGDQHCTSLISPAQCAFSVTLPTAAILLAALGATLPTWGPALEAPARRAWQARTYRRLEPLWAALYQALPQIALAAPAAPGAHPHRDLGFRLYRRVIEILDGRLVLRPYRDPRIAETALTAARRRGLTGTDLQATVEAAQIAAALETRTAGPRTAGPTAAPRERSAVSVTPADLASEAAWLAKVSDAFTSSLIVREHARRAGKATT